MTDRLQNKMYNYEVVPPSKVWGKITESLDSGDFSNGLPPRLYNLEITPPATTWEKIQLQLEEAARPTIKRHRLTPMFRYAIAATIIGVIALGSLKFFRNSSKDNSAISTTIPNENDTIVLSSKQGKVDFGSNPEDKD